MGDLGSHMTNVQITIKMKQGLCNLLYTEKLDQYLTSTLWLFEELNSLNPPDDILNKYQNVYESYYGEDVDVTSTITDTNNNRLQSIITHYNVTVDQFITWSISAWIKHSLPLITAQLNS